MEKRSEEQKKEFAKQQLEFLKQQGIKDRERLSRIFKIAGPGQIQEAWLLATSEDWTTPIGKVRKNILDCIIYAAGGAQDLSKQDISELLEMLGFYIPRAFSSIAFFKVLDGALEILVPNSVDLEESEEEDITKHEHEPVSG